MVPCGTNYRGNPRPSINWIDPDGLLRYNDNYLYRYVNDETGTYLNISRLRYSNVGRWTCKLFAVSDPPVDTFFHEVFVYLRSKNIKSV